MSHTHKVAWAAGFFDGEGYLTIQERSHPKYIGYYLRLGINHVAIEPLLEMQKLFGGKIEKQSLNSVVGNRHPRHKWTLSTSSAKEAILQMMPFFQNKQKVAEVALEFQTTIGNRGQQVSPEIQEKRKELKAKITYLNSLD